MKKLLIVGICLVVVGVGYWFLSPLWRTERVDESLPETVPLASSGDSSAVLQDQSPKSADATTELFTGSFVGFDRLHQGSGTAKIIQVGEKTYVRFESDFTVSNGPDLFVGFGKDGKYISGSEVGALKGNVGAQNYELPGSFDITRFNEVYVWCRAFSVPFTKASLSQSN